MATKIEILSITPSYAGVALYYVVSAPMAQANDQSREAAGNLSGAELQALKDGTLHELVKTLSLSGMTKTQAKVRIESSWPEREEEANKDYQRKYRDTDLIGKTFDGSSWS